MRVYLAGPINGCTDAECRDWREAAKAALRHPTVDPMVRDYRGREDDCAAEIVELDKADIDGCTHLLVNYPGPSTGTDMEILYAWERGVVPVAVVPAGTRVSPWLRYHCGVIVPSFAEAYRFLNGPDRPTG